MSVPQLPIFQSQDKNFSLMQTRWASILNSLARNVAQLVTGATNLGTGSGVFAQDDSNVLQFKSLVAGSNVTLTNASDSITIAASGGGGSVGTPVVSSSCGSFSTGSATFVDVTNLTVTITTSGGPVWLRTQADGTANDSLVFAPAAQVDVRMLRGASSICVNTLTSSPGTVSVPASSFSYLDTSLAAGTYTYKVQMRTVSPTAQFTNSVLVAQEL